MGMVKKIEPSDRAMRKIRFCREAGMDVHQDYVVGTAEIRQDGEIVLLCTRITSTAWQMEYNDQFWEEQSREPDGKGGPA